MKLFNRLKNTYDFHASNKKLYLLMTFGMAVAFDAGMAYSDLNRENCNGDVKQDHCEQALTSVVIKPLYDLVYDQK